MADAHSTPDTTVFKISQAERFTRVGYRPIKGNHATPAINIAGQWLKDAGFTTGQPLRLHRHHHAGYPRTLGQPASAEHRSV
ncbi:SymE family type I addiction module toxin [Pectobacterium versatile]|uniref:SymE family type I addiction module toxin n=1 Tax=Pectobacterium versatile TaxID=2488639 RepID=UPI003D9A32DD